MVACETASLTPKCVDIVGVRAGDRNVLSMVVMVGDGPRDLTDATLAAQARAVSTDVAAALTATVTVTDADNGEVDVQWDGDDVRTLLAGSETWTGAWDMEVLDQGETDPDTVMAGTIGCVMDVTR